MRDYEERWKQELQNEMIKSRARDSKTQDYDPNIERIEEFNNPKLSYNAHTLNPNSSL